MIGIGQMYRCSHKIVPYGIEGYQVEKKYEQNQVLQEKNQKESSKTQQKKRQTKKGHYLQDQAKIHQNIPGPGGYDFSTDNWKQGITSSKGKVKHSKKLTYIDEIMQQEKKKNLPAPGQYKLFKDEKDLRQQKKRLAHKKINHSERFTYLDGIQYQASTTPGVGAYNPESQRPKSATMICKRYKNTGSLRPVSGLKNHPKQAQIGTYNPKRADEFKSFSKKTKGYHEWGRQDRFKSQKDSNALGPGTYFGIDENRLVNRKSSKSVYYG